MRLGTVLGMMAGIVGAATTALAAPAPAPASSTGPMATPPKLVVVISVDQFSFDLYRTYAPTFTGGLKRLSAGHVFTGYQSHAATETCPGHSTLLTGDHPNKTGIVANNWYDRKTGSNLYCVSQTGTSDERAKSNALLKVDTLGDWMRSAQGDARVYSVSGKDRAAIMMAGHNPNGVYWWDDGFGFTTSSFAGPDTPATRAPAEAFNQRVLADWAKTPPALWSAGTAATCLSRTRPFTVGKTTWTDTVPPQTNAEAETGDGWLTSSAFAAELRASPLFDRTVLQFAAGLLDQNRLGRGPGRDILAVSLSATDYIGHRFGPGGAQMCAQMAELDASLADFFARLDATGAPYVVLLSADHGSIDVSERVGPPSLRIEPNTTLRELGSFLRKTVGLEYDPIVSADPRQLVLGLGPVDDQRRPEITRAIVDWLNARPEVARAFTAAEVAAAVPPKAKPVEQLTLAERFNESFDKDRSGDIMIAWKEGASLGIPGSISDTVAGHGSPWDYDRQVPILVWWPGISGKPQARSMETVDIAPTLAPMLGVTAPAGIDGHCVELGQGCKR